MKDEEKTLYQICQDATNQAISESVIGEAGFLIDDAVDIVKEMTSASAYNKEWLFDSVIRSYIAVSAHDAGYRSGIRRQKAYFHKDICNESISWQIVLNAQKDAENHQKIADELHEGYSVRFSKDTEMSGQFAFDNENDMYEERTLSELIALMKGGEADT